MSEETTLNPVELATEITIAWLNNPNNRVAAEEVPAFLRNIHATVNDLASGSSSVVAAEQPAEEFTPAVTVRKSLASKDHIISLIDGKPYKTLTRHLTGHGLTPDEYRRRYGLRFDYPMVAQSYAEHRRELAKRIGLGRRPAVATSAPSLQPADAAPVEVAPVKAKAPAKAAASARSAPAKTSTASSAPKAKAAAPRKKLGIAMHKAKAPKEAASEAVTAE